MIIYLYTIVYNKILVYLLAFFGTSGRARVYSWIHAYALPLRTDSAENVAWGGAILRPE
jgi:hypothetical protein